MENGRGEKQRKSLLCPMKAHIACQLGWQVRPTSPWGTCPTPLPPPFPILDGNNSQQWLSDLSPESPGVLVKTQIAGLTPRVSDPVCLG